MTAQKKVTPGKPVAVIDLGSNSVRLVVFDRASRALLNTFNEKILCGLGRMVASTGEIDSESAARALAALGRFKLILNELKISNTVAFATAAVRDAGNGRDFLAQAEQACGVKISILSGAEEATYAVHGVIYGSPAANGLVGDLGGGSLELSVVRDGDIGICETFPLGALALMDMSGNNIDKARTIVDDTLKNVDWLSDIPDRRLYAVGGAWRTLARIHMSENDYALRILQHYTMPKSDILDIIHLITQASRRTLERMSDVPSRRIDSLPFSALVLEQLFTRADIRELVISAYGVREGIVFAALPEAEREKNPVIEGLNEIKIRFGHAAPLDTELISWSSAFLDQPVFGETEHQKFLRQQATLLHDIAWADHPDHRAELASARVLFANIAGVKHYERMYMATIIHHRYTSGTLSDRSAKIIRLDEEDMLRARIIGATIRLGLTLSGGVAHLLPKSELHLDGTSLHLSLPVNLAHLNGEAVEKRLEKLASILTGWPGIIIDNVAVKLKDD